MEAVDWEQGDMGSSLRGGCSLCKCRAAAWVHRVAAWVHKVDASSACVSTAPSSCPTMPPALKVDMSSAKSVPGEGEG